MLNGVILENRYFRRAALMNLVVSQVPIDPETTPSSSDKETRSVRGAMNCTVSSATVVSAH